MLTKMWIHVLCAFLFIPIYPVHMSVQLSFVWHYYVHQEVRNIWILSIICKYFEFYFEVLLEIPCRYKLLRYYYSLIALSLIDTADFY